MSGLGTHADYITCEFVAMDNDVTVITLNPRSLKIREIMRGVVVHKPLIADIINVFPMFVIDDLKKWTRISMFNDIIVHNILSGT